jgi:hypothetical protein
MQQLVVYALSVYLTYHLASRADLLNGVRAWVRRVLPARTVYPLDCPLCWAFWVGVVAYVLGLAPSLAVALMATPVICLVVDLLVRHLLRLNEPPTIVGSIPSCWTAPPYQSPLTYTTTLGASWSYPLPQPQRVGRRARVARGHWSCLGKEGVISRHIVDDDDCSGTFRQVVYDIDGVASKVLAADCDLLDDAAPPQS